MKKNILVLFFFLFTAHSLFALPRFGLRQQNNCADCHVNPTGGGMRNTDGWYFGRYVVSMVSPRDKEVTLSPQLNDNISIGLDVRTQYLYSQELKRSDFQNMSGTAYSALKLSGDIDVVAGYDFVQFIWEAFAVLNVLPANGYLKFGAFKPNYGIRIDDHTAYTRGGDMALLATQGISNGLIYSPFYTETGVEAGIRPGDNLFITTSIGKSSNNRTLTRDPTYTARAEYMPSFGRLQLLFGGSYASAKLPHDLQLYGAFAGFGYKNLSVTGEYDIGNEYPSKGTKSNYLMVKGAYRIKTGLEAILRYDSADPDDAAEGDKVQRIIVGAEFFPYSFIELRPQYRFALEENNEVNNDSFVLQFHIWY